MVTFRDYQLDAIQRMHNGCILCGGVGSGKSLTSLGYFFLKVCEGTLEWPSEPIKDYISVPSPTDLYIITTARKRDTKEWDSELLKFYISPDESTTVNDGWLKVTIDSWNNIGKYADAKGAFFIFDEQRVVGYGAWVKAFLKIAKSNRWILLSATPGDTWMDYLPVFIANGYFRNKTEFNEKHVVYRRFAKYPQIERYLNQGKLLQYKRQILVNMDYKHDIASHRRIIEVEYDRKAYLSLMRTRWNAEKNQPFINSAELCYAARKVVNGDASRTREILYLISKHPKVIIFYNYDYELEILKKALRGKDIVYAEWNGHKHEPIPKCEQWAYLVQYRAGAEGWNCIETNTIIFYSLNYSYKTMIQAAGRTDRMNTPYNDLYYYTIKSGCPLDTAILRALAQKKNFNENRFFSARAS